MRVIGIDPGLRRMGWGVIDVDGPRLRHVGSGILTSGEGSLAERLCRLHDALSEVVARLAPDEAAVEETFVNKDPVGTLKLGQARGIALLVPALAGLAVAEYAPNAVKKAVVGTGHAQKEQVEHMVRMQLPGAIPAGADAADALAVAICHAHHAATRGRYQEALMKAGGGGDGPIRGVGAGAGLTAAGRAAAPAAAGAAATLKAGGSFGRAGRARAVRS